MTVKAILWTYEKRTDGTADVKIYTYPPKRYHSTGIKLKPKDWDGKKGRVRRTHPNYLAMNAKIEHLLITHEAELYAGVVGKGSLLKFLELYIEEIDKGLHPIKQGTRKNYQSTYSRLSQYCQWTGQKDFTFNDCDLNWYAEFCRWLVDHGRCKSAGLLKHAKILKKVFRVSEERNLHTNRDYKRFKATRTTTEKIYLRQEEIEKLEKLDLSDSPHLARERDRFLVSYYLLMRYGDSVRIHRSMAYEENGNWFLRYQSEKTNVPVVIPIKPACRHILERHNWDMGQDTNQEANRHIKQVAAMAGINEPGQEGDRRGPKWKFVTTHTARRSGATNMALQGVSVATIAKLGGWNRIATLKAYLRASGKDVARAAVDLDFFR